MARMAGITPGPFSHMAKKTLTVDPNTDDADDTQAAGDQSPRFQKLSAAEALALLTEVVDPALAALPDHALDTAAENSKIVVVNNPEGAGRIAVLATPDGAIRLPAGDRAHILPIGVAELELKAA